MFVELMFGLQQCIDDVTKVSNFREARNENAIHCIVLSVEMHLQLCHGQEYTRDFGTEMYALTVK